MIDFNRPAFTGKEFEYIQDAVNRGMLCGDGIYTKSEDCVCGYPSGYHEH